MVNIPPIKPLGTDTPAATQSVAARASGAPLTRLLLLLLLGGVLLSLWAGSSLSSARENMLAAGDDLGVCHGYLADLDRWSTGPSSASAPQPGEFAFAGRLSAAAAAAGIPTNVASVEPGQPSAIRETDFTQTPVFVRVDGVSVRQLVTFLHGLSAGTSTIRTQTIELSPAPGSATVPNAVNGKAEPAIDELWTSDVTLAYLTYAPREKPR